MEDERNSHVGAVSNRKKTMLEGPDRLLETGAAVLEGPGRLFTT